MQEHLHVKWNPPLPIRSLRSDLGPKLGIAKSQFYTYFARNVFPLGVWKAIHIVGGFTPDPTAVELVRHKKPTRALKGRLITWAREFDERFSGMVLRGEHDLTETIGPSEPVAPPTAPLPDNAVQALATAIKPHLVDHAGIEALSTVLARVVAERNAHGERTRLLEEQLRVLKVENEQLRGQVREHQQNAQAAYDALSEALNTTDRPVVPVPERLIEQVKRLQPSLEQELASLPKM